MSVAKTVAKLKCVFFTDEKAFYLDSPVNCQNKRMWAAGRKHDIPSERLVKQHAKFSAHVMVSVGICYSGKGWLHFVADKVKINAKYYMEQLLPGLLEDCHTLLQDEFMFQQDGAPAHTAALCQTHLMQLCPDFAGKDEWPPNSPDLNPLDFYVWGAMLDKYENHNPKPKNTTELKATLQDIWNELPQEQIELAILSVRKRLTACVNAAGSHFEHLLPQGT